MADQKKKNAKPAPKKGSIKEMSKADCKKTVGGLSSFVSGGLAGPEDFTFTDRTTSP